MPASTRSRARRLCCKRKEKLSDRMEGTDEDGMTGSNVETRQIAQGVATGGRGGG